VKAESDISLYLRWSYCSITRTNSIVQLPALIAKLPATALNSFSQAPSGIDVVSLSVVRKFSAPSSGNSTAPARCLRGGKRPVCRHRAYARCPCSFYRSLGCLSVFSGLCPQKIRLAYRKRSTVGERLDRVLL